jgi:hypothetical protein
MSRVSLAFRQAILPWGSIPGSPYECNRAPTRGCSSGRRCLTGVDSSLKESPEFVSIDGRCRKGVDHSSDEPPKLVLIDEQPYHEIVHALRLGEAQRAADESLDPGPQIDMLALDFLRVLLAHLMLGGISELLVCSLAEKQ